ncbi:MAG: hypothetical protein EAY66_08575 [Sphingobacteriales bacterium]|nr:MAG: hypothetical protein EAY66_08575 [Sphingobacteriales bacterium]
MKKKIMEAQPLFIAHPTTLEETNVLKAFVKALKIKFEVSKEKAYDEKFVQEILKADKDIEAGKGVKIEMSDLWK